MKRTASTVTLAATVLLAPLGVADTASAAPVYPNCAAAHAARVSNIHRGEPGYRPALDHDHDGVACEEDGGGSAALGSPGSAPVDLGWGIEHLDRLLGLLGLLGVVGLHLRPGRDRPPGWRRDRRRQHRGPSGLVGRRCAPGRVRGRRRAGHGPGPAARRPSLSRPPS